MALRHRFGQHWPDLSLTGDDHARPDRFHAANPGHRPLCPLAPGPVRCRIRHAALDALRSVLPQARLRIADTGVWWAEPVGAAAPLVVRPGWLAQPGAPLQPPVSRFETDAAGQLWLAEPGGLRTPLHAALAEPAALLALLRAADAQALVQVQPDGSATVRLAGVNYRVTPVPTLHPVPAQRVGEPLWLESAQGQLLLWMQVGDGRWAQSLVVSAAP